MRTALIATVVTFLLAAISFAQPATRPVDNAELKAIFEADQGARSGAIAHDLMSQDAQRRQRVRQIMDAGEMRTAADHFHAAMVFQHGDNPDDYKLAHDLASKAAELDPDHRTAKWLSAAAMDRWLRSTGKPQIYGTQFMVMHDVWALQPIDETAVTDEQRQALGVPTLAAAKEKVVTENARRTLSPEDNRVLDGLLVEFVTEQVQASRPGEAADSPRLREISARVAAIVDAGRAKTARDLSSAAAMLEAFAQTPDDYRRVLALMDKARALSPEDPRLGLTWARAFDRVKVAEGGKQWYGTFALSPGKTPSGRWEPPQIDPASPVTDEERAKLGIPLPAEWTSMVDRLNREHPASAPATREAATDSNR